jgi:hypothetical protein
LDSRAVEAMQDSAAAKDLEAVLVQLDLQVVQASPVLEAVRVLLVVSVILDSEVARVT